MAAGGGWGDAGRLAGSGLRQRLHVWSSAVGAPPRAAGGSAVLMNVSC